MAKCDIKVKNKIRNNKVKAHVDARYVNNVRNQMMPLRHEWRWNVEGMEKRTAIWLGAWCHRSELSSKRSNSKQSDWLLNQQPQICQLGNFAKGFQIALTLSRESRYKSASSPGIAKMHLVSAGPFGNRNGRVHFKLDSCEIYLCKLKLIFLHMFKIIRILTSVSLLLFIWYVS